MHQHKLRTILITLVLSSTFAVMPASAEEVRLGPVGFGYSTSGGGAVAYASCSPLNTACAGAAAAISERQCAQAEGTFEIFVGGSAEFEICASAGAAAGGGYAMAIVEAEVIGDAVVISHLGSESNDDGDCDGFWAKAKPSCWFSSGFSVPVHVEDESSTSTSSKHCEQRRTVLQAGPRISCAASAARVQDAVCFEAEGQGIGRSTFEEELQAAALTTCQTDSTMRAAFGSPERVADRIFTNFNTTDLPAPLLDALKDTLRNSILVQLHNEIRSLGLNSTSEGEALETALLESTTEAIDNVAGTVTVYVYEN